MSITSLPTILRARSLFAAGPISRTSLLLKWAVTLPLPALRHEHRGWTSVPDAERDRLSRRNFYRIIDRFGWRNDLVVDRS